MAKRPLENTYELPNINERMTNEQLKSALTDFDVLTSEYMQIVNKQRRVVPFVLNPAQRYIFKTLWPMIDPKTRLDRHRQVVCVKGRQVGMSVSIMAFVNYICAFASGIEYMTLLHILPVSDTIQKLTRRKVEPIITGVHPDIFPRIERDSLGASVVYNYENILGIPRHNHYELVASSASSIRGDTVNVALYDEAAWYRNPEALEDIVGGALPDQGFALSVFFSTYGERQGDFFRKKLLMARDNPEEMDLIFVPWFLSYPEQPLGANMKALGELSDYELNVIIPALKNPEYGIPEDEWADKILWYRRKCLTVSNMRQEFPTTLDEIISMGENKCVFSEQSIQWQEQNRELGVPYSLLRDSLTKKVVAHQVEESSFKIYREAQPGHTYIEVVDPIVSENEESDYFAMSIFDTRTLEQVATFHDNNMPIEDYADICVCAAKLYNNAQICPEQNMGEALMVAIRNLGYYYFWYNDPVSKAAKKPGLRTTFTTKSSGLEKLKLLLEQHKIVLHDSTWIDELSWFEKKTTVRRDGTHTVKMAARRGKHDDTVSTLWLFANTLNQSQLLGFAGPRWAII